MSNQPLTAVQIKYAVVEASQSVADSDRPSAAAWQRSDPLWDLFGVPSQGRQGPPRAVTKRKNPSKPGLWCFLMAQEDLSSTPQRIR
ncbi:MAG: hypothetical protein ACON5J_14335, partial [Rubripirellula sp.]